jgi:hypothetical protein
MKLTKLEPSISRTSEILRARVRTEPTFAPPPPVVTFQTLDAIPARLRPVLAVLVDVLRLRV